MKSWIMRILAIPAAVLFVYGCAQSVKLRQPAENSQGQRVAMQNQQGEITLEIEFHPRADQNTFVADLDNAPITSEFPTSGIRRTATVNASQGPHVLRLEADMSPSRAFDSLGRNYKFTVCKASSPPFCDRFARDGYLRDSYRWFDEGRADTYQISGGQLQITAGMGQDLWGELKRGAPLMLHPAPEGNYAVESFVDSEWSPGSYPRTNTQVGLFVFENVENWLFFGFTFHRSQGGTLPDGNGLIITSTIGNSSRVVYYEDFGPPLIGTLKIEKSGNLWRFYVKSGSSWNQVGPPVQASFGCHEVGMGVKSFKSGGTAVRGHFDNFCIR